MSFGNKFVELKIDTRIRFKTLTGSTTDILCAYSVQATLINVILQDLMRSSSLIRSNTLGHAYSKHLEDLYICLPIYSAVHNGCE